MEWIFHIGIAQSIFSAFILFTKKHKSQADGVLAFWLIFIALELIHMLLEIKQSPIHDFTSNFGFYSLTFGPFLYLYVVKLTQENPKFRALDLVHFLPYVILSLLHLAFFTNRPLRLDGLDSDSGWFILTMSRVVILCISLSVYSYMAIKIILKHKKSIKDNFSYKSSKNTLSWLSLVIFTFLATYVILIANMLSGNLVQSIVKTPHFIPAVGLTFFCFSLSYFGFNQPVLFQSVNPLETVKDSKQGLPYLSDVKSEGLLKRMTAYLQIEKPYLNPELTIQELAEGLKLPRHYITEVLKSLLDKNFFTLVNEYRMEEVKNRLLDPDYKNDSILQIALESGFNSKSSFNAIFKQHTGLTPTEYRKGVK